LFQIAPPQAVIVDNTQMSVANRTDKGDLQIALKNAADLLTHDPKLAQEQANEILKVLPNTPKAKWILATSLRLILFR
jgi:hypothetical protein